MSEHVVDIIRAEGVKMGVERSIVLLTARCQMLAEQSGSCIRAGHKESALKIQRAIDEICSCIDALRALADGK